MPNPFTGSVIVKGDRIVGEGWHCCPGSPHAEIKAITDAQKNGIDLSQEDITLFVNLEPCVHFGRTPPCVSAIVQAGIKNVVFSHQDPDSRVNGEGLRFLQEHGVNVRDGVLKNEGLWLNRRFVTFHKDSRPYIVLKWAQTKDGFIARTDYSSKWITDVLSRQEGHRLRATEQAILVGFNTALYDNPSLTVRLWEGTNPIRIVWDLNGELPANLNLFSDDLSRTFMITSAGHKGKYGNVEVINVPKGEELLATLNLLKSMNVLSLLVEGGSKTIQRFIDAGIWDEIRVFENQSKFFYEGIKAPQVPNSAKFLFSYPTSPSDTCFVFVNAKTVGEKINLNDLNLELVRFIP